MFYIHSNLCVDSAQILCFYVDKRKNGMWVVSAARHRTAMFGEIHTTDIYT